MNRHSIYLGKFLICFNCGLMSTIGSAIDFFADNLQKVSIIGSIEGEFSPEINIWNDLSASKDIFYCKVSRIQEDLSVIWVPKTYRFRDQVKVINDEFELERTLKVPLNFCKYRFSSGQLRIHLPKIMRAGEDRQKWWIQVNIKQVEQDQPPQTVDLEVVSDQGYHSVKAIDKKDLLLGPNGQLDLSIRITDKRP